LFIIKKKRITIFDVAKRAGVAISTVSFVLNKKTDKPKISHETQKKVRKAAKELGFEPDYLAQSLATGKSKMIGLVLIEIASSFYPEIIASISNYLEDRGYMVILCSSENDIAKQQKYLKMLVHKKVEGIILNPLSDKPYIEVERYIKKLAQKIPILTLCHSIASPDISYVKVDNVLGGYMATKHLIDLGHTHIAYVSRGRSMKDIESCEENLLRYQGYLKALDEYDIKNNSNIIFGEIYDYYETGKLIADKLARVDKKITGIFAYSDLMAKGIVDGLRRNNIFVPDDLSIIGFDDLLISRIFSPPLTTISQPKSKLGEIAAHNILQMIHGKGVDNRLLMPEIVVRETTTKVNSRH